MRLLSGSLFRLFGNSIELSVYWVMRPLSRGIRNKERFWIFRAKFVRLYEEFEAKLEDLCQEHNVEINLWYSPSKIPQPAFRFGRTVVDADTLYDEKEFSSLFSPKISLDMEKEMNKPGKKESSQIQASGN